MSIGEVLAQLRADFPDVTISKIRFLESEGLVEPARTPSGYRKFCHDDVERLRYVLAAQRDHYLPLRVIKEHLDALDRGLEPPAQAGGGPRVPRALVAGRRGCPAPERLRSGRRRAELRLSREPSCSRPPASTTTLLAQIEQLRPGRGRGGTARRRTSTATRWSIAQDGRPR